MGTRKHKIGLAVLIIALFGASLLAIRGNSKTVIPIFAFENKKIETTKADSVSIGFVGDITPDVLLGNPKTPFDELKILLQEPDIMVGNLEGTVTDETISKCKTDSKNCFAFKGDSLFVDYLVNAGFDVLNMANNHAFDFGGKGFIDTQKVLHDKKISSIGAPNQVSVIEKNGIKIAFVGFAPNSRTNSFLDKENIIKNISNAKSQADIVIAVIHAGGEGINYSHVKTGDEIYLNENRGNTVELAHLIIDSGASAVFGSGPHILRGVENYKGKIIAYSMGNFFGAGKLSTAGQLKFSGFLNLELNKSGEILNTKFVPIVLDGHGTPHLDPEDRSISTVNDLSKEDFGERAFTF